MSLATVGAIVGIGSGINSLTGGSLFGGGSSGSSGGGGSPYQYIPTGQNLGDTSWQSLLQSLMSGANQAGSAVNPQLQQAYQQLNGLDPSGMLDASNRAGGYYGNLAGSEDQMQNLLIRQAQTNTGAQNDLMRAGQQFNQTAQDPQNALRNQLQQQVTDASRAGTSARGIGMSGNAAGIENNDVQNFLMNWQNNQLQRQATGLQGLTGAYQQAGQQGQNVGANLTGAAGLGTMAAGNIQQSGQLPYAAYLSAYGQPFANANAYTGAQSGVNNQYAGIMSQIIPYLNFGSGATNNAFGQSQTGLNNLTTGLGQLGQSNIWNSLGNLFSGQQTPTFGASQGSNWSGEADPYGGMAYPS
jgi:hypothetical protein